MQIVSDRSSNPFGISFPCEEFVSGYGDVNADFHVIGDHPGVHGGVGAGIPFTGRTWSPKFFAALAEGGLIERYDPETASLDAGPLFLSYLYPCIPTDEHPDDAAYTELEPLFDAELRAITADVLLPVGTRATDYVLANYTAKASDRAGDVEALHATEIAGSGWLVIPIREPSEWSDGDAADLVGALQRLAETDYRQLADLGRFVPDDRPYYVR